MDKLLTIAKIFLQSIKIIFVKISNIDVDYDTKEFTAYKVTIANPNNDKSFSCTTLIDNIFISKKGKVSPFILNIIS